jgi:hypothetical protein
LSTTIHLFCIVTSFSSFEHLRNRWNTHPSYMKFATHVACVLDVPPVGHPVSDRSRSIRPSGIYPSNTPDTSEHSTSCSATTLIPQIQLRRARGRANVAGKVVLRYERPHRKSSTLLGHICAVALRCHDGDSDVYHDVFGDELLRNHCAFGLCRDLERSLAHGSASQGSQR